MDDQAAVCTAFVSICLGFSLKITVNIFGPIWFSLVSSRSFQSDLFHRKQNTTKYIVLGFLLIGRRNQKISVSYVGDIFCPLISRTSWDINIRSTWPDRSQLECWASFDCSEIFLNLSFPCSWVKRMQSWYHSYRWVFFFFYARVKFDITNLKSREHLELCFKKCLDWNVSD